MREDAIVAEVRKSREAHAAKFGYDVRAIVADARKREQQSGRQIVSLARRKQIPIDDKKSRNS